MLNHIITKAVCKHLSRQRWDRHPRALPLKYIPEILKVRVATTNARLPQLEGGDVGFAEDLVVGVHRAADTMGAWILDLQF